MKTSAYGIAAVEYATPSVDGTLPTSGWTKISPISDDAVTFEVPAVATNLIRAQDVPGVFEILPGDTDPVKITFAQLQVDGATAQALLGGTYDDTTKRYDAPATDTIVKKAFRLTSQPLNGQQIYFWIRKGAVLSGISVSAVRNDLYKIGFSVQSVTPVDASGVPQSPWGFQTINQTT
jgi:hypothetical protein